MRKFINQDDMKRNNCLDIFYLIKALKKTTRKELKDITNMSVGAISNIISLLIQKGYVEERKAAPTKMQGRIPSYLQINSTIVSIGVEIGALGITVEVFNLKNKSLKKIVYEDGYKTKDEVFEKLFEMLDSVYKEFNEYHIMSIGLGIQGMVDTKNQLSVFMVAIENWKDVPVAKIVSERYNTYTYIEHDTECMLFDYVGNTEIENCVLIGIDKGIGMAAMLGGNIVSGKGMWEFGHAFAAIEETEGVDHTHTLEDYASEMGLVYRDGRKISEIAKAAENGEEKAKELFALMGKNLGIALYNVIQLLHPEEIFITGRMTKYSHLYEDVMKKYLLMRTDNVNTVPEISFIGEKQVTRGVAMLATEHAVENIEI